MPSVKARVTRYFLRRLLRPWLTAGDVHQQRRRFGMLAAPRFMVRARIETAQLGAIAGEWLLPHGADDERVLYYLHGGAFIACSPATHRESVARIARAARM